MDKLHDPQINDGCTIVIGHNRLAGTVTDRQHNQITVTTDAAIRIDDNGPADDQVYKYERDDKGQQYAFSFDGTQWKCAQGYNYQLLLGIRDHYINF